MIASLGECKITSRSSRKKLSSISIIDSTTLSPKRIFALEYGNVSRKVGNSTPKVKDGLCTKGIESDFLKISGSLTTIPLETSLRAL